MAYQVLFMDENAWYANGKPELFETASEAAQALTEHFLDMEQAEMDFNPEDYQIAEAE
jgi:hypothetical protein